MPAEAPGVMTGGIRAAIVESLVDLVLAVLDDEGRARAMADRGVRANSKDFAQVMRVAPKLLLPLDRSTRDA